MRLLPIRYFVGFALASFALVSCSGTPNTLATAGESQRPDYTYWPHEVKSGHFPRTDSWPPTLVRGVVR